MTSDDRPNQPDEEIWIPDSIRRKIYTPETPPDPDAAPAGQDDQSEAPAEQPESAPEPAADEPPAVDYMDKYLRALAEADNQRKRSQELQRVAVERANERFVLDLLPVIDALQRGLDAASREASVEVLQQGMELVGKQLRTALLNHGVEPITCEVGDEFDPERHEAMMRGPATEAVPEGHISEVLAPGYTLAGRVIRAAKVAVAAPPFEAQAD